MEALREYLLGMLCTALFCGIITGLVGQKSFCASAVRLLAGFCMVFAVVAPLTDFQLPNLRDYYEQISWEGDEMIADGEAYAKQAMKEIIMERTRAYILEKAESCGAALTVELTLSDASIPVPIAVKLSGNISPYHKNVMTEMLEDELGITAEDQTWIISS